MRKRGVILTAAMLAGHVAPALCASAGGEAAPFLKIDAGARPAAMGGAFSAIADDASAVFYNPAGAGLMANDDIMLSHNEWIGGLKNEHFAWVHPQSAHVTLFTGLSLLLSPSLDKYDENGLKTGTFGAAEGALSAGLALGFTPDFCFGLAAKGVYQRADTQRATAYAGDAGFIHRFGDLRFGLAVQNLGTQLKLYKESFALPLTFRGGAAYRLNERFWFSADAFQSGAGLGFAAGAEGELPVTPTETVFARAGYKSSGGGSAGPGISAGMGLKRGELRFDYAFAPYGDLGDTHRLTVSFRFGSDRENLRLERKFRKISRKVEHAESFTRDEPAPPAGDTGGKADNNGRPENNGGNKKEPSKKDPSKKEIYFMW